jgi:hypothetical protein
MSEELNQNQIQEESKPVYKMGSGIPDVEEYKEAESHGFKTESEPESVENKTIQNETATIDNNTQAEENASSFSMPVYGETAEQPTTSAEATAAAIIDWKNEIKKANPKEILKELGYDDFIAEFAEFRKNGGDAYKYLEAKAFDWGNVTHQELVKDDLKLQYPHLTDDKIERLYQAKYKQSDMAADEDREVGLMPVLYII